MPSLTPVIVKVVEFCPAGIITVLGTVASVVSLELRVTTNWLVISVLRVIVAVAVPVSEITSLSITMFKLGLSLSTTFKLAVAFPVSKVIFVPV